MAFRTVNRTTCATFSPYSTGHPGLACLPAANRWLQQHGRIDRRPRGRAPVPPSRRLTLVVRQVLFALHGATGGGCDETEVREWLQRISTGAPPSSTTTHAARLIAHVADPSSDPNPHVADPSGEIDIYDLAQIIVTSEGPAYHRTAKVTAPHRTANTYWAALCCAGQSKRAGAGV